MTIKRKFKIQVDWLADTDAYDAFVARDDVDETADLSLRAAGVMFPCVAVRMTNDHDKQVSCKLLDGTDGNINTEIIFAFDDNTDEVRGATEKMAAMRERLSKLN